MRGICPRCCVNGVHNLPSGSYLVKEEALAALGPLFFLLWGASTEKRTQM